MQLKVFQTPPDPNPRSVQLIGITFFIGGTAEDEKVMQINQ